MGTTRGSELQQELRRIKARVKRRIEASKTAFAPGRRWTDAQLAALRRRLVDAGIEITLRNSEQIAAHASDMSGGHCPDGLRPLDLLRLMGMRGDDAVTVLRLPVDVDAEDEDVSHRFARVANRILDLDPRALLHATYLPHEGVVVYVDASASDRSFEARVCEIVRSQAALVNEATGRTIRVRGACRAFPASVTAAHVATTVAGGRAHTDGQ